MKIVIACRDEMGSPGFQGLKRAQLRSSGYARLCWTGHRPLPPFGVEHDERHELGPTQRYCVGLLYPILQGFTSTYPYHRCPDFLAQVEGE